MQPDKRRDGGRGWTLTEAIPTLGLRAGDRITEQGDLKDIADIYADPSAYPLNLVFWRRSSESLLRRRNPLLSNPALGLSPDSVMVVDQLHAVNLGIMLAWCKFVVWGLIDKGFFTNRPTVREQVDTSLLVIRSKLSVFIGSGTRRTRGGSSHES